MLLDLGIGTILYGNASRASLAGAEALKAQVLGLHSFSFLAVRWLTVLYFPLLPLGTYRVTKSQALSPTFPITPWPQEAVLDGVSRPLVERVAWRWDLVAAQFILPWGLAYVLFHLGEWLVL